MQGYRTKSLFQQVDQDSHTRLREAFGRFFTQKNTDTVYNTLRSAISRVSTELMSQTQEGGAGIADIDSIQLVGRLQRCNSSAMSTKSLDGPPKDSAQYAEVDAVALGAELVHDVVLKVRMMHGAAAAAPRVLISLALLASQTRHW